MTDIVKRLRATAEIYRALGKTILADEVEEAATEIETLRGRALTKGDLADALSCFWNAAIGAAHERQDAAALSVASIMAEGFAAVGNRLREIDQVGK